MPFSKNKWLYLAAAAAVMAFIFSFALSILMATLLHSYGNRCPEALRTILITLPHQLLILLCILLTCFTVDRHISIREKLCLKNWSCFYIPEAIGLEFLLFPIVAVVTGLFLYLLKHFEINCNSQLLIKYLLAHNWTSFAVIAFAAIIVAPVTEEIMFRRIIFEFLSTQIGRTLAFIATSALFAMIHFNLMQLPGLFILGMTLQWLYLRHHSLFPSILFHMIHNGTTIAVLFFLKLSGFTGTNPWNW